MLLDDIIIYSQTFDEHFGDLHHILRLFNQAGVSVRQKTFFITSTVDYLGHVVRLGQLCVASKTLDSVQGIKPPNTLPVGLYACDSA